MNESEFEAELRALKPAAPSPTLATRIAAELPAHSLAVAPSHAVEPAPAAGVVARSRQEPVLLGLLRRLLWAGAGAAVATVVLLNRAPDLPPTPTSGAPTQTASIVVNEVPDQSVSELIESADEGLIYDQDSATPQRQMRYTYLERHFWTNPQTGAVIEFEVPREDIVLMPVAMQ